MGLHQPRTDTQAHITTADLAERFGCSPKSIDRLRKRGAIRATMIGSLVRFTEAEVERFIAANQEHAAPAEAAQ